MKNNLLILAIALIVFPTINYAQSSDAFANKISIGLKVGANLSNVYDSEGDEFTADPKVGLAVGGFVAIPLGEYLGVQPEILFSQKGFKGDGSFLGSAYSFSKTVNYIDVPILFAVKPSKFITVLVGPQYSYLISQKYEFNNSFISSIQEEEFENENIRKNTLCLTWGADINLNQLVVGARMGYDILNNNGDGTQSTPQYKNMWYQATVGIRF